MKRLVLGLIVSGLCATPAWAGDAAGTPLRIDGALRGLSFTAVPATPQAPPAEAEPKVKALVGVDLPFGGGYFFRGYRQEGDPQVTLQPFVDVAIAGESASFNIGSWNSIHTGNLDGFYESDIYAAVTVGKLKATYTGYLYPNDQAVNIHELMFSTTIDHMLAPSIAVAVELAKEAGDKGIYAEFGIAPAVPMADDAPVSITVPVKIGLSLKDYYFNEDGDNAPLGYISGGLTIGKSLTDSVEVHGGVTIYGLTAESTKFANNGDAAGFVVSFGLSAGF
jgi:hypothetical protein